MSWASGDRATSAAPSSLNGDSRRPRTAARLTVASGLLPDDVDTDSCASSAVIKGQLKGDVTIVKLGASERYEIPDALITGG